MNELETTYNPPPTVIDAVESWLADLRLEDLERRVVDWAATCAARRSDPCWPGYRGDGAGRGCYVTRRLPDGVTLFVSYDAGVYRYESSERSPLTRDEAHALLLAGLRS